MQVDGPHKAKAEARPLRAWDFAPAFSLYLLPLSAPAGGQPRYRTTPAATDTFRLPPRRTWGSETTVAPLADQPPQPGPLGPEHQRRRQVSPLLMLPGVARQADRPDVGRLQLLYRPGDVDDGRDPRLRERPGRRLADDPVERRGMTRLADDARHPRGVARAQDGADVMRDPRSRRGRQSRALGCRVGDEFLDRDNRARASISATTPWCAPPRAARSSPLRVLRSTGIRCAPARARISSMRLSVRALSSPLHLPCAQRLQDGVDTVDQHSQ